MTATCPPKLTIVIPTFNSIEELPGCLESIRSALGELLGNTIIVIVQDGQSTDGTKEYLENTNTDGIIFLSEQDSGVYDAMNKAISRAETDWIYFLGSDDRLLPDFRTMLGQLKSTEYIYYANVRFARSGKRYDGSFSSIKLVFRNISHQSIFFPSQILKRNPYSLCYPIKSDWAKNIQLFSCTPFKHVALDIAIYNDEGGLSSTYDDAHFEKDKADLFYQSFGYGLKFLCGIAPTVTQIFHFMIGRKKKTLSKFRNI
jgi:glycosyltransferase involved in cell wall biosynthesis